MNTNEIRKHLKELGLKLLNYNEKIDNIKDPEKAGKQIYSMAVILKKIAEINNLLKPAQSTKYEVSKEDKELIDKFIESCNKEVIPEDNDIEFKYTTSNKVVLESLAKVISAMQTVKYNSIVDKYKFIEYEIKIRGLNK